MATHSSIPDLSSPTRDASAIDVTGTASCPKVPGSEREVILANQLMTSATTHQLPWAKICLFSTRSPQKTTANEDVAGMMVLGDDRVVLAVADGLGGHACGEIAAKLTVETLFARLAAVEHALQADRSPETCRAAILSGIESANQEVNAIGSGAATTLTVVEIHDNRIRPYHVGDSITMLVGQRGKIKLQTIPHSPVGYAVESGMIDAEDAIHHEDRHVVSNVIGSDAMRIEIGPTVAMSPRDTLILSSDGLVDNLLLPEIVEKVRKGPMEQGIDNLAQSALARMDGTTTKLPSKPDDLTIVALRQAR